MKAYRLVTSTFAVNVLLSALAGCASPTTESPASGNGESNLTAEQTEDLFQKRAPFEAERTQWVASFGKYNTDCAAAWHHEIIENVCVAKYNVIRAFDYAEACDQISTVYSKSDVRYTMQVFADHLKSVPCKDEIRSFLRDAKQKYDAQIQARLKQQPTTSDARTQFCADPLTLNIEGSAAANAMITCFTTAKQRLCATQGATFDPGECD